MAKSNVDKNVCIGCGSCMSNCPHNAISFDNDGKASVDESKCVGCGACESACPVSAIKLINK